MSREPNQAEKRVERVRQALVDQGYAETYSEVAEAMGVSPSNLSRIVGGYDNTSSERANEVIRKACVHYGVTEGELLDHPSPAASVSDDEPVSAPQTADTAREESPSRPESGEGGTDSVSEEQPEAPSGEPEETGSTPGGEEDVAGFSTSDEVEKGATPRPTIQIEADGQRFVATRNGDGWDLELVALGVDRETANRLHDVAFGLLIDRLEEAST